MSRFLFIFSILFSVSVYSQVNINSYKYFLVEEKFDFLKTNDQYQTSSLTKFLFNKNGYTAFLTSDVYPEDLTKNRCLALAVTVLDDSNMFKTKNRIELRNCKNEVVFVSKEGISRLKEYKRAYHEAIMKAFNSSLKNLNYKYEEKLSPAQEKSNQIANLGVNKEIIPNTSEVLYAQEKPNGYQLINTKPEIVFEVLKTSNPAVFVLENKTGVLLKKGENWIVEYYENNQLKTQQVNLKF